VNKRRRSMKQVVPVSRRISKRVDLSVLARLRKLPTYLFDPSVSLFKKLGILLGVIYIISPIDAVADFIPVVGWLDDIGVLGLMYLFMMKELSSYIESHHKPAPDAAL
jgi:uncharacterized membrane protein YkvA (DUF1232 family)